MMIRCSFSIPLEKIRDYNREVSELSYSPDYILRRGPYFGDAAGGGSKIIITYDFEKTRLVEAWEAISKQVDRFRGLLGFTLSAHILEKSKEVKRYPMKLKDQGLVSYANQ